MIEKVSSFYKMTCFFLSLIIVPLSAESATRSHAKKHARKAVVKPAAFIPQEPASWEYLHTMRWGGTVYIDENNIKVNKNIITARLLYNLKEKRIVTVGEDVKDYASLTNIKKMDCQTGKQETLNEMHYAEFMGRGEAIADNTRYENDKPMYRLKTDAFWLLDNVCKQYSDMNILVDPTEKPQVVKPKKKKSHKKQIAKSKKRTVSSIIYKVPAIRSRPV